MPADEPIPFEALFESTPDGLVVVGRGGEIVLANRHAEALLGRGLLGTPFAHAVAGFSSRAGERRPEGAVGRHEDLTARSAGGEGIAVEAIASPVDGPSGWTIVALRDVSGRKREQEVLQTRIRQQARVVDLGRRALTGIDLGLLMGEAVNLLATDLGAEFVNLLELLPDGTAVLRAGVGWRDGLVGGTSLELADDTPAGRVVRDQTPVLIDDLRTDGRFAAPSAAREHGAISSLTVPLYGQARPLGVLGVHSARPRGFAEADVHFVQAVANVVATAIERHRDEERLRERQMVRAEQMAAIGQVAAGVAHELRNPLTSIKGLIQVNLREAESGGLPADDLRVIEHEVRRMERTLQTFLDFARPPRPDRRRLDLADVVDRVYALVGGRARKQRVALRFSRPDRPVWVDGDRDQLQQLVLNLVLNALDAMPDGGAVEADFRSPRDGFVDLLVRDTGPGIAADVLPKVFETFVSNKETGLGLGLPVSKRIAEDHDGTLAAYNLPAGGACFSLRLPAT